MNATLKNLTITTLAIAAAIALAGCTTTPQSAPAPTETAIIDVTPAPATPDKATIVAEVQDLAAGTILTEEQAAALKNNTKAEGVRAYVLPTGEHILVKKSEPLPAPVQAAEEQKLAAIPFPSAGSLGEQDAAIAKLMSAASGSTGATGKRACIVALTTYANADGPGASVRWATQGCPTGADGFIITGHDKGTVVATVTSLVAAQPDASSYAIIVEP